MPERGTQIELDKARAERRMKIQDGATPRVEAPPVEYLEALEAVDAPGRAREVTEAHKQGNAPPTPGNGNSGGERP